MLYGHQLLPVEVPLLEETEARDVKYLPCSTHVGKWQTRGLSRLAPAPTNSAACRIDASLNLPGEPSEPSG